MNFVTIKESHYLNDLTVLKSKLESEGIPCRLKNEFTNQVMSHMATFVVELQVPENYLNEVRKIMLEIEKAQSHNNE